MAGEMSFWGSVSSLPGQAALQSDMGTDTLSDT